MDHLLRSYQSWQTGSLFYSALPRGKCQQQLQQLNCQRSVRKVNESTFMLTVKRWEILPRTIRNTEIHRLDPEDRKCTPTIQEFMEKIYDFISFRRIVEPQSICFHFLFHNTNSPFPGKSAQLLKDYRLGF